MAPDQSAFTGLFIGLLIGLLIDLLAGLLTGVALAGVALAFGAAFAVTFAFVAAFDGVETFALVVRLAFADFALVMMVLMGSSRKIGNLQARRQDS
jgi:hypothetical protein